ncbi:NACHT domain-containing protein [Maridesulfovibrio sp.]|uniref:NACHT domain-containing protein n=1 Tax=Maridesulfovibrio sp. TaxID=2795000 RepID=UPI003BAB8947
MLPAQYRFKAFIFICLLMVVVATMIAIFVSPLWGFLSTLPILAVVYWLRRMFIPGLSGQTRVQLYSLVVLSGASGLYWAPPTTFTTKVGNWVLGVGNLVLQKFDLPQFVLVDGSQVFSLTAFALLLFAVIVINVIAQRRNVSLPSENLPDDSSLNSIADRAESLKRYTGALIAALDRYDRDVNWSDREFTPLEAEIESERTSRHRPRIVKDIVASIKKNKESQVFILLGDPGSGKSVSLRRLVRELCKRAASSGVVPVYVNLREFPVGIDPTEETLMQFIRDNVQEQTGKDGRAFLESCYDEYRKNGRLFFVIDSFDEMPSVLDCDDKSESHRDISAAFDRFFTQDIQSCRAIVASRVFRAPVGVKGTMLMLRPFREQQIRAAMKKWLIGKGLDTDEYVKRLFRERPQLVPLLRNPFTAELISEYARYQTGENLPENMFSIFDCYVTKRFETDLPSYRKFGFTVDLLREAASIIARGMYESGSLGLEADVEMIETILTENGFSEDDAKNIIYALEFSRIARGGGYGGRKFSFVHRRFAEFFVVNHFHNKKEEVPYTDIPKDSRWRDCIVMYCGIVGLEQRKRIAKFCWREIHAAKDTLLSGDIESSREAIHCLRFLADAFRADADALEDFRDDLGEIVLELLDFPDLLIAKIGSEGILLLNEQDQQKAIVKAFETESSWVCDSTLRSCRHLSSVNESTHRAVRSYLSSIPSLQLIRNFSDLNFTLGLSDAFRKQKRAIWADVVELGLLSAFFVFVLTFDLAFKSSLFLALCAMSLICVLVLSCLRLQSNQFATYIAFVKIPTAMYIAMGTYFLYWKYPDYDLSRAADAPTVLAFIYIGYVAIVPIIFFYVLLLIGWENLLKLMSIKRIKNFFLKFNLKGLAITFGFAAASLGLVLLTFKFIGFMEDRFGEMASSVVLLVVASPSLFYIFSNVIWQNVQEALETRRMRRLGLPEIVTCSLVYDNCMSFKHDVTRRKYLEMIRVHQIPFEGEVTRPPAELILSKIVRDELARLRGQWAELTN